ncbi:transforming growth factor beta regulator 1 [Culex quinquefasciatus]|uniref:transforming growth factor beta regulator 1 n=1 Tax=Culex quinquefasciatus TaxID=7176 RepID=UPI0018E2DF97|nr:transforming growth factor beta regulator 1 [Culex quinquefasciatus]
MKTLALSAANQRRDYVFFAALRKSHLPRGLLLLRFVLVIYLEGGVVAMQNSTTSTSGANHPTVAVRDPASNARYRRKYCKLKRYIKDLLFENASLCDHVAQVQEHILLVKEERRYLLKKLLEHENEMETQLGRPCSKLNELIANSLPPKRQYKKRNSAATATPDGGATGKPEATPTATATTPKGKPRKPRVNAASAKKNSNNNSVQHSISLISQTMGHPTYPITVAGFTIYNLGEITPERTAYNSDYTIYPVGYTVARPFGHLKDPTKKCIYTCRVLDNGPSPRFEIIPEHDPELTIAGNSTDACHATLLQCINASLNCRGIDGRPSGDWFFGLSHPTISSLIQSFPASKKCVGYRGIKKENFANMDKENDPTLNYDALQRHIALSAYHTVPEIKEEPPDELLDHSDGNSFSLS